MAKCVVLNSSLAYSDTQTPLLLRILSSKPDLFSVVGVECGVWEEAMDWLCIDQGVNSGAEVFCNTTSHPNETLAEVVSFAEQWCELKGWSSDVEVIESNQSTNTSQLLNKAPFLVAPATAIFRLGGLPRY